MLVSLSLVAGVGALGSPVKVGLARSALVGSTGVTLAAAQFSISPSVSQPLEAVPTIAAFSVVSALTTKAVVAMLVSLSAGPGVGARGSPLNTGETRSAFSTMALSNE